MTTVSTTLRRRAVQSTALTLAAITLAGLLSGCGSAATAQAPDTAVEASAASTAPVAASPSPSSTGSAAPSASASATLMPPDAEMSEEWREKAKTIKHMGASGVIEYANTADGAVIAFEDFFNLMAWEFATSYEAEEDDVSTDAEKDAAIDSQFFRTIKFIDREKMGRDQVNDLFGDFALEAYVLGASEIKAVATRQGITKAKNGTVTITDANLFYPDGDTMKQVGDGEGPFTMEYRSKTKMWVIINRDPES